MGVLAGERDTMTAYSIFLTVRDSDGKPRKTRVAKYLSRDDFRVLFNAMWGRTILRALSGDDTLCILACETLEA
jgi:hypothetical protein